MVYKDKIYGKFKITEPVVLEIIKCPAMQRLKGINQYGYIGSYLPEAKSSRFEHSMGVFCLLRKYKAPLAEQIAGLLHDVSHSAFSHCIDYVLKNGTERNQSHQDDIFKSHILKTEIPRILKEYKISLDYIFNDKNFPLKERNLPDICADRIDYFLRDSFCFGEISKKRINYFLNNLKTLNKKWFFASYKSAKEFSKSFFITNGRYYSGLPTALMFKTVGDCLKFALEKGYINKKDLYTTDKEVLDKIRKNVEKDKKLDLLWRRMNKKIKYKFGNGMKISCKSRAIDPFFIKNGKLMRVSDIDKNWKEIVKKESKPKEYFIEFER
ncbi:MAG: HD domain-containing protein [Patescibacteria group bacterium]